MKVSILTLFPEMIQPVFNASIIGKAQEKNLIDFEIVNIRDFADNKHKSVDDYPFGGGAGMVMTPQPVYDCMAYICRNSEHLKSLKIYLSPRGKVLSNTVAQALAQDYQHLILLCGHYEGVDERVLDLIDCEISIGDYILTGGELAAMVLVDCVSRFIPGVLGSEDSAQDESFSEGLLEYPQYTRPQVFRGKAVPEILLSGHHKNIASWRKKQALKITKKHRPDLLENKIFSKEELKLLQELEQLENSTENIEY